MTFAKCAHPECNPIEQCRGKMGPGDYFGVRKSDGELDVDHYLDVTPEDGNPSLKNIRIACSKCALATPWGTADLPNMPGIGRTYLIQQWEGMIADKEQKKAMIATLREQFGDEAYKKHFSRFI